MKTPALVLLFCLVFHYSYSQTLIQQYTTTNGLPDDYITGVAVDGNNNIWASTASGLAFFDRTNWYAFTTADGLPDNYLTCIAVDFGNRIWIGSDYGVSMYDGTSFTNFNMTSGLIDNSITSIAAATNGNIYITTLSGLSVYNGTGFSNYTSQQGLPSDMLICVRSSPTAGTWAGSIGGGLIWCNGAEFNVFNTENGLSENNISCIAFGLNNEKYVGSFAGIDVLNDQNECITSYNHSNGMYAPYADGMYHNFVQDITTDIYGNLWACTFVDYLNSGGISVMRNGNWTSITSELPDVMVRRVCTDHFGVAWIASGAGIIAIDIYTHNGAVTNDHSIRVYPNPIESTLHISSTYTIQSALLCDITGKTFVLRLCEGTCDVSHILPGYYVLMLYDGVTQHAIPVIKNE